MKYTIIFGLFATIFAVSAMPKDRDDSFSEPPEILIESVYEKCSQNFTEGTFENYLSFNTSTITREAKCLASCIYTETGKFHDGKFDVVALGNELRQVEGLADVVEEVVKIIEAAAEAANEEKGDDCDKAYAFDVTLRALVAQSSLVERPPQSAENFN